MVDMRAGGVFLAAFAVAVLSVAPARGVGTPTLEIATTGAGYERVLTVELKTPKGKAVRSATVVASGTMNEPGHFMSTPPVRLVKAGAGLYRGRVRFPMLGEWVVRITATGSSIRPVTARVVVRLS
jgi:hypothetical protein